MRRPRRGPPRTDRACATSASEMDGEERIEQDEEAHHHPHPGWGVLVMGHQREEGRTPAHDPPHEEEEAVASVASESQEEHPGRDEGNGEQAQTPHGVPS
jgi:hypothetical protein